MVNLFLLHGSFKEWSEVEILRHTLKHLKLDNTECTLLNANLSKKIMNYGIKGEEQKGKKKRGMRSKKSQMMKIRRMRRLKCTKSWTRVVR